jgi:hypothetical protein
MERLKQLSHITLKRVPFSYPRIPLLPQLNSLFFIGNYFLSIDKVKDCKLTGFDIEKMSQSFSLLTDLKILNLSGSRIYYCDGLIKLVEKSTKLTVLNLSNCGLCSCAISKVFELIPKLPNLRKLIMDCKSSIITQHLCSCLSI